MMEDSMDLDEQVLNEVASLRASNWQASTSSSGFENHRISSAGIEQFFVLDSNVLISYLPLVKDLLAAILRRNSNMALCLPIVVVEELNFLKERNSNPNTRALAQQANVWLLAQMRNRTGAILGQQRYEKILASERPDQVNDDRIVDYCEYLLATHRTTNATVILVSNDQNCCLKAELQGIKTISPNPMTSADDFIAQGVTYGAKPPRGGGGQHQISHGSMDLDEEEIIGASDSHPLSVLHRAFLDYLTALLPQLAYDAALKEQERRDKLGKAPVSAPKSSLFSSRYAPKSAEPAAFTGPGAFVMPTMDNVRLWTAIDCITFCLELPSAVVGETVRSNSKPDIAKLRLFLLPAGLPGSRKGKDWSVGDWMVALDELERVASFCQWAAVQECVEVCRQQLRGAIPDA